MATFTFSNDNRYYNPLCDSSLLYDNEDGDTNRKLCMETTCIAPIFEGTGRACEYLLPDGYEDKLFEWGVQDAAWTLNPSYDAFTYRENQFVEPFQITDSETGDPIWFYDKVTLETYVEGGVTKTRKVSRYISGPKRHNTAFKKVIPPKGGFQPMKGRDLSTVTLDAESLGSAILTGTSYTVWPTGIRWVCNTSLSHVDPAEVSYFDVGSRQVPGSNTVTLKDAPIICLPVSGTLRQDPYIEDMTAFSNAWDIQHGAVSMSYPDMPPGWIACDANANGDRPSRAVRATPYPITCVPKDASALTVDMSKYSTDRSDLSPTGSYVNNPYNYYPELGTGGNNIVKIFWETAQGLVASNDNDVSGYSVVTGYRMQKCLYKNRNWAHFYVPRPAIGGGFAHVESYVYALGYKIRWEFISATPKKYVTDKNSFKYSWKMRQVPIADAWPPFTVNLRWMTYEFTRIGTPTCSGDVEIKFTYIPFTYPSSDNFPIPSYYTDKGNLISQGYSFVLLGDSEISATYSELGTHYGDFMPYLKLATNNRILNYQYKLPHKNNFLVYSKNLYDPLQVQSFTPYSNPYFWRRLIGGPNSLQNIDVDYTYSNRKEWFNGTCPFTLKYDNIQSDIKYHPTQCSSSITPIVIPTG